MKQLTKILLINWHMFSCTEIQVKNNMIITGHNGAGKSTLLDAVQYVLTGGKTKFNLAANEEGSRKLEGYVRGRLGTESQEYLRSGDVTTHIALEFYDESDGRSFIFGAVIDLPEGGKCRENFYTAYRVEAEKDLFIRSTGEILTKSQFERNLKKSSIRYRFAQTKEEARQVVNKTLGVSRKYTELITRALAFKPISDLNEFMYRFLLPEEKINIDSLRKNVQMYRKFEDTLKEQQERLAILEEINTKLSGIKEYEIQLQIIDYISGLIFVSENMAKIQSLKAQLSENDRKINLCVQNEKNLTSQINDILDSIADIQTQINALDPDGRIRLLQDRQKLLENRFNDCREWRNGLLAVMEKDRKIFGDLSVSYPWNGTKEELIEDPALPEKLVKVETTIREMHDHNVRRSVQIEDEIRDVQRELNAAVKLVGTLEKKQYPYDSNVQALIDLLREELSKATGREIRVRPFCEYLEINDEQWRDAIEGYLNTQRFDLLVEPQYFARASRIYEQFKSSRGIYGVGIVDTGKLAKYTEIREGTLAEKVETDNIYARQYANMLLGKVVCEENVEQLNLHRQAITPTCMIYHNFTVRAINPRIYSRPFIGRKALEMQLETARDKQNEFRTKLQNVNRRQRESEKQRELLLSLNLDYVSTFAANQQNYITTSNDLNSVKEQLKALKKDPSWATLGEQLEEMQKRQSELNDEKQKIMMETARLRAESETKEILYYDTENALKAARTAQDIQRDELLDQMERIDREYERLRRNARGEYSRMRYQNEENRKRTENDKRTAEYAVTDSMHAFNLRTGFGFEESLQAADQYTAQYDKLRLVDIESSINRTIEARQKCEKSFQEDFISTLRARIERAKENLKQLNRALEDKNFQGDRYSFVYDGSADPVFARYYRILCSNQDYPSDSIFMEELSEQNRNLMDDLFSRLVAADSSEKNERLLRDYTDYRKYMKYDIRISHANGDTTFFSKVNREKSGGETQTPFYVIIAASFDQVAIQKKNASNGCLVLFDEAFNNMDENRIEALMRFYRSLNIQLMIAVPEGRVRNIMPYTETKLLLVKQNNRILTKEIIDER